MKLSELQPIVKRSKKRVGRGHGSGRVKTAGRGTKGQNARDNMPVGFEGGQLALIRRLPLLRGKGKNRSYKQKAKAVSVGSLSKLPSGTTVTIETLQKHKVVSVGVSSVKIVGAGSPAAKLTVRLPVSKSAQKAIEKAGGTVSL